MEEKKEKQIVNSQAEETAPEGMPKAAAPEDPAKEATPEESLKAALAKQAIEEEASGSASFTLRKILGGDILTAQIIRKQIWLFVRVGPTAKRAARHQVQGFVYQQPDNRKES